MLTIDLDDFMFELQDGAIKHVGPSTRSATVKLYDTESVGVREYGDKRVKLSVADDEGNESDVSRANRDTDRGNRPTPRR